MPFTTDLGSDYYITDSSAVNHQQDRQISDPVSAVMGNGCLPKKTILGAGENEPLGFV